jgi:hypothetical protein
VALLLLGAFFGGLQWLGCLASHPLGILAFARDDFFMLRVCTVGLPGLQPEPRVVNVPGFSGPYWGNLMVLVAYLVAAVYVGFTKRRL